MSDRDAEAQVSLYERMGGHATFEKLVAEFYRGVAGDPELRAMYPEADLGPAEVRLRMFLEQYWGGPTTYSEKRGHPRLRMRHVDFAVTSHMRDRWLHHMTTALETVDLDPEMDALMRDYLVRAADMLVNTPG